MIKKKKTVKRTVDFYKLCDRALLMTDLTKPSKVEYQYNKIGDQYRKKIKINALYWFAAIFFFGAFAFCPPLFDTGNSLLGWVPQTELFVKLVPYLSFVSLLICIAIFLSSTISLIRTFIRGHEAIIHLRACVQKDNKEFQRGIAHKEKAKIILVQSLPNTLGVVIATTMVIYGMNVNADPAWAVAPMITLASSSIVSIVINRSKSYHFDVNNENKQDPPSIKDGRPTTCENEVPENRITKKS